MRVAPHISQLFHEYLTSSHKFLQVLISSQKPVFTGLNYRCGLHINLKESPALLLSVIYGQHGNDNRVIPVKDRLSQQFSQRQGCFFTCARSLLEYDAYDVLLKCVLPANIKRRCWILQVVEKGDVLVYTNDVLH